MASLAVVSLHVHLVWGGYGTVSVALPVMNVVGTYTRQKERRLKIQKSRRTSSSSHHTDELAAQKVLKVSHCRGVAHVACWGVARVTCHMLGMWPGSHVTCWGVARVTCHMLGCDHCRMSHVGVWPGLHVTCWQGCQVKNKCET